MLAKLEAAAGAPGNEREYDSMFDAYRAYMRREISLSEFVAALEKDIPSYGCPCGSKLRFNEKCWNWQRHLEIQTEIRAKFSKGDRVIYNMHAYPADCPGRVAAYVPLGPENGTFPWAWLSVKFDHLKGARRVPIFDRDGWHLEHAVTEMVEV